MSFLLKDIFHTSLAETVYEDIIAGRSIYHYFIGRTLVWGDEVTPESPESADSYEYDTRNSILSIKKIKSTDISLVVPRRDWVTGSIYDQYDGEYSADYPATSGATSIKAATFYVLNSAFNVYKCLDNNNGAASTSEPTGTDFTSSTYADGYIWKYLYTIPLSLKNRFLTSTYMPVQKSIQNQYYSGGEVDLVVVDSPGTGYLGNAAVTLTVNGRFNSGTGNITATLRPVLNETGQFIDVLVDNAGGNYSNASIVINDTRGTGTSYYKGLSNVLISNVGASYSAAAIANTAVSIVTTGSRQPGSNAKVTLNFSNAFLSGVTIVNRGSGYNTAVIANTTLSITTTGNSQPTINAQVSSFFTSTAVLTPVIYNNQISKVLIEDQGIDYSANNQTFINLIGDGTGAALTPFVNAAGQVEDIIIESRGSGYTYLDVQIVGDGTGANAYVDLSTGDLNTQQSTVELSAVDGAIHALRVTAAGNNYTTASISLTGDGDGFVGTPVIYNNTISSITVTNPGSGYTFADVTLTGSAGSGNANVTAILSPAGGHGLNPVRELFADAIMLFSTINDEKNQGISIVNDYRQFGVIKDVTQYSNSKIFANITGSSSFLISVNSVGSLARDTVLRLASDTSRKFDVIETVTATNQILLNSKNNYIPQEDDVLNDTITNIDYTVVSIDRHPTINKFSGELLYVDNRTAVSYSDEQLVKLRTVIKL